MMNIPMRQPKFSTMVFAGLLSLMLSGCDSIPFIDTSPDYKAAGRSRPLEVPPDLTSISSSDTYTVPGATTYSDYAQGQAEQTEQREQILPNPENVRMERAGSQRWLVVEAPPEKIWPAIREFWAELGFAVRVENPQTGVMETEWVDPSTITKDDKGNYLDKFQGWLDRLNTLQNRQKFRTRIDRGTESGTTEIYLSHRSVADVHDDGKERVRTSVGTVETGYRLEGKRNQEDEVRANAEDIDAELLRRLMVHLGVEEQQSRAVVTAVNNEIRAVPKKAADGSVHLAVNDNFDRAWRRVGLALDRVGFVVEDRDRSSGLFYVRYSDIDADGAAKPKKGIIDSLKFWDDEEEEKEKDSEQTAKKDDKGVADALKFWDSGKDDLDPARLYLVKVENAEDTGSKVSITNKDGSPNRSNTAGRILNLLYEQLK
jgi:outer membrane protein assembly factor BamC